MSNSLTAAALSQPQPITLNRPKTDAEWTQFATTLNQWLNRVILLAANGSVTLAASPGAGTLTVNSASGENAIVLSQGGLNGTGGILQEATATPTLLMNSPGPDWGQVGSNGTQTWFLGHGPATANGTAVLTWGADGSVVIGNPTGGPQGAGTINCTGLFVNGVAVTVP